MDDVVSDRSRGRRSQVPDHRKIEHEEGGEDEDEIHPTNQVRRMGTDELTAQADAEDELATTNMPRPVLERADAGTGAGTGAGAGIGARTGAGAAVGAAFLSRAAPSKLPWLLVGMLGVAVMSLVAYIVLQ